jgi:sugar (pentulose or hexulose) kinase
MLERLSFDLLRRMGAPTHGRFTISGGAVKSDALNQMRADVLERELAVPAVTESAFGMAVLAASTYSSMKDATRRIVRIDRTISPRRGFSEYAHQYNTLVQELDRRGWLPAELRTAAEAGGRA